MEVEILIRLIKKRFIEGYSYEDVVAIPIVENALKIGVITEEDILFLEDKVSQEQQPSTEKEQQEQQPKEKVRWKWGKDMKGFTFRIEPELLSQLKEQEGRSELIRDFLRTYFKYKGMKKEK